MKTSTFRSAVVLLFLVTISISGNAQDNRNLQFFRTPGNQGLNQFETLKDDNTPFTGVKVRVGGDFAMQFQGIDHSTESSDTLATLGSNFNLPTANLNIDVQLADGVRMSTVTYMSSRHHRQPYVKGGHIQIDKLDFIKQDFLANVMEKVTVKIGLDEINYGDAHFRRSDNARTIYNPFVGNYIMDAFTTEAFGEVYFQSNGVIAMAGLTNGKLNQSVIKGDSEPKVTLYGKAGYDSQVNDDLRVRLTASVLSSPGLDNGNYLYNGDRAGARYYAVMQAYNESDDFRSGRFSPRFRKHTSVQINPFVKWKGLEFFGVYEMVNGDKSEDETGGSYTQIGAELIYRIGQNEKVFVGGRFNRVDGQDVGDDQVAEGTSIEKTIQRINVGGGWFLTDNVMAKVEYVLQTYDGDGWIDSVFQGGEFSGAVIEAVISF